MTPAQNNRTTNFHQTKTDPRSSENAGEKTKIIRSNSRSHLQSTLESNSPKYFTANEIFSRAMKNGTIDLGTDDIGRNLSPEEIVNLIDTLDSLNEAELIDSIVEFNVSGQRLGDANVNSIVAKLTGATKLHALYLDGNEITNKFRKPLFRHLLNKDEKNLRFLILKENRLGEGKTQDVELMVTRLKEIAQAEPELKIDVKGNSFSAKIVKDLENLRRSDNTRYFTINSRPAKGKIADSPLTADAIKTEWHQRLEQALGVELTRQGNVFHCGAIPAHAENRQALIEVLSGNKYDPGSDEIALEFKTDDGPVRLTRAMASSKNIADVFVEASFILQD